jgi:HAD superfamily phosphatase
MDGKNKRYLQKAYSTYVASAKRSKQTPTKFGSIVSQLNSHEKTSSEKPSAVLFDMDGVLVDVRNSYRKAIQETVRHFTGKKASPNQIQQLKERGGYNNDWDLTEALIEEKNQAIPKQAVIDAFQQYYVGPDWNGFIQNEKWLIHIRTLQKISNRYQTGIVTGRPRQEAQFVLRRFNVEHFFDVLVAMEDYPPEKAKPDPYPIELALEKIGKQNGVYVGDSVDDIVSAKVAGLRPIGCFPPGLGDKDRLKLRLVNAGAEQVIENVNEVERILL